MHATLITLRLLHVVLATFWVGTLIFIAVFLEPSVRAAGPAGGAVMQGLQQRGYFTVMPIVAIVAMLSGGWLLWIDSAGFDPVYMGSAKGIAYSTGALAALVAFAFGVTRVRGDSTRMGALGAELASLAAGAPRDAQMAEMGRLRERVKVGLRVVASLLFVAVVAMAVARYL